MSMQVVMRRGSVLTCEEAPEPVPLAGQTVVKSLACGICGSDLHTLHYGNKSSIAPKGTTPDDTSRHFVFGHEFCGEVLEAGPGGGPFKVGTRVVSMPFAAGPNGTETIGYSARYPGGFAERMVLTNSLMLEVPNGLAADIAALTEPMAVGAHGVSRANLDKDSVVLIIGMGPVGAAVLINLKARGIGPIIAADFSPRRRKLAEQLGADVVVDPAVESPHRHWADFGVPAAAPDALAPLLAGHRNRRAVIFECVGNPGILQSIIAGAPFGSEIVLLGVCMEADTFQPGQAVTKEVTIKTGVFYSAEEFAGCLRGLAEGTIDGSALITDHVGLGGVADAFERLKNPEEQIKIMVEPGRI
jgi:2-desacetyl-2-hydroxyethyl bacteriochlorophyllide A dehydrogenase